MASGYRPHIDALDGMDREPCLSLFILNPPRTPMNTLHPSGAPVFFEDPPRDQQAVPRRPSGNSYLCDLASCYYRRSSSRPWPLASRLTPPLPMPQRTPPLLQ